MSVLIPNSTIIYDPNLVEAIASRLDLRAPNREALHAIGKSFDVAAGGAFEAICEIATAVGKTYLAAGVMEYLFEKGVRNILIVTPGRTVLNKTLANFSPGTSKYVAGLEADYILVTADNFNRGAISASFEDDTKLKLFVFTVQALIRPGAELERRTREFQEWIGGSLHTYLQSRDDLVIIGDEHHVYAARATAFSAAINDLNPIGIIGLTATADTSQRDRIIYEYPLARALCDRLVKIPVLVGRTDNKDDLDTKLGDGLALLRAKQQAADTYRISHSAQQVNAVMLVIAESIDQADLVGEILARPNLLGDKAAQEVLVIHSQSSDLALEQLAQVEEATSPTRVIINVAMLKEGWDVKNIFVILSLRPSVSDTLTEQTLGRGLRLPYGKYTGQELLDTVEVISHDKYEKLLSQAGVLIKGLSSVRAITDTTQASSDLPAALQVLATPTAGTPDNAGVFTSKSVTDIGEIFGDDLTGILVMKTEDRIQQASQEAAAATPIPVMEHREVFLPKVTTTMSVPNFSLSTIEDSVFAEIGRKFASQGAIKLDRKILEVVDDGAGNFTLAPRQGDTIDAVPVSLPLGEIRKFLVDTVLQMDIIANDEASRNGATRLIDAAIQAAGGEANLETYHESAATMVTKTIKKFFQAAPSVITQQFELFEYTRPRLWTKGKERNRFGAFSKEVAYGPWEKSSYEWNWFDSTPELTLANLLDADIQGDGVSHWCRILRHEGFSIEWSGGTYTPDFYVSINGVNHLVEVKADNAMNAVEVVAKKNASNGLARTLTDDGSIGTWKYSLVSETDVNTFRTVGDLLRSQGT